MKLPRLALVLFLLGSGSLASAELVRKQAAAPPADIESGLVRLPERSLERSQSAWLPLEWRKEGALWRARVELAVEREGTLALALVGPDARRWSARALGAGLAGVSLETLVRAGRATSTLQALDEFVPGWDVLAFELHDALPSELVLEVFAPPGVSPTAGFAVAGSLAPPTLASALEGLRWTSERPLVFAARIEEADAVLESAEVELTGPLGKLTEPLRDDGLGADELAADGTFSASISPRTSGQLFARVLARGRDARGAPFLRSTQHALTILEPRAELTGRVTSAVLDATTLALDVEIASATDEPLQLACEVWAERPGEGPVPVVWLARTSAPRAAGLHTIRLALDGRWLNAAAAAQRLELRAVRLQDPDTHVVLDALERVPLAPARLPTIVGAAPAPITVDMLSRVALEPGAPLGPVAHAPPLLERPLVRSLMLVHGYCAGGSPWPPAQFSQPKSVFNDPNQNRTHDQFAQLIAAFAASQNLDSFGVVAHSQGGAAALHLLTFYESGLDHSFGGRRIQSVGTPYQGTPLASLGSFSCGVNNDMTPAGSAAWLASIPSWARAEVHYWTTSNTGSACNFFSNLILASPNDGVIEMARGQLPGADNRGHKTGWCHTTGMSNPAQYTDATRNAEMNAQAAR